MREATIATSRECAAFEDFFEAEYERILRAMYLACGQRHLAEELTQEAMARAFERWDRIRSLESPAGYVMKTAYNLHHSWFRKAARIVLSPRPERGHEPELASGETRYEVIEALRSLPATQREVLLLVEWFGLTSEEAGIVRGIDPASVRGRIYRARNSLRNSIGDDYD